MPDWLTTTALVITRIAAMLLCIPGVSNRFITWRVRLMVIAALCVPVLCVIPPSDVDQGSSFVSLVFHEAIVGISLSLVPAALVFGLQTSVQAIQGMTGLPDGLGSASSEPLNGNGGSSLGRLMLITCLAVFFVSSGHRVVFQSVLESFEWLPPGSHRPLDSVSDLLLDLLSASFRFGVRAMTPIGLSLGISLLAVAAVSRVLPQVSYFAVGMSVQAVSLFASLFLFGGAIVWSLDNSFATSADSAKSAWQQVLHQADPKPLTREH